MDVLRPDYCLVAPAVRYEVSATTKFWPHMSAVIVIAIIFLLIAAGFSNCRRAKADETARLARLHAKYADPGTRQKIEQKMIWVGMTYEQLEDSWGKPSSVSRRILKTKIKETCRYGSNRYGSSVYLDNGLVTGWRQVS